MSDLVFQVDVETSEAVASINAFFDSFKSNAKTAGQALRQELGNPVETEVKLEFKNGKLVAKEVEKVKTAADKVLRAQQLINGEFKKTPKNLREQVRLLKSLREDTVKYKNGTKELNKDWVLLNKKIKDASRELRAINSKSPFASMAEELRGITGRLTTANLLSNAIQGAFNKAGQAINYLISEGLKMELLDLQLQGFTGSAQGAEQAMERFIKTAIQTPLNVGEVAAAGKTLLAFGLNTEMAADATHRLAIIAGATGGDMNNLSRNVGQIAAQQRAYTRDLNQFAVQGIPIYEELSRVLDVSVQEVRKMAEDGKIGFTEVQKAIANMTAEGSAFAQIADEMQNTWTGQIEAMQSSIQVFAKEFVNFLKDMDDSIGGPFQNSLKLVSGLMKALADNVDLVKVALKTVTVAITAFIVTWGLMNFGAIISGLAFLVGAFAKVTMAIWSAVTAQAAFQALLGPAGLVALTAGVVAFGVAMSQLRGEQDVVNKGLEDTTSLVQAEGDALLTAAAKRTAYGEKVTAAKNKIKELNESIASLEQKEKDLNAVGLNSKDVTEKLAKARRELTIATRELQTLQGLGGPEVRKLQQELLLSQEKLDNLGKQKEAQISLRDEAQKTLDDQIEKAKELVKASDEYYDGRIAQVRQIGKEIQDQINEEKRANRELADQKRKADEDEIRRVESKYDKAIKAIEAQLGILDEQSPLEQRLAELERQKIVEKIRSGELDEEELLRAQIRLERMDKEVEREQLLKQQSGLREQKEAEINARKERQRIENELIEKSQKNQIKALEDELRRNDESIAKLEEKKKAAVEAIEAAIEPNKKRFESEQKITTEIAKQISEIEDARTSYEKAKGEVEELETAINKAAREAANLKIELQKVIDLQNTAAAKRVTQAKQMTAIGRFAGGPVEGGATYTVNEIGREAFLSASGRLSMINAPAWGAWRAPSDGAVIPAHLTKRLEIPASGVNLNKGLSAGAAKAASGSSLNRLVSTLNGISGGDSITNNVTIQSANTRQTASDVMVQLAKLKRVRYS